MLDMKNKNKMILIGGVLAVLILVGIVYLNSRKSNESSTSPGGQLPTEVVVPTVDASVKVTLTSVLENKRVMLSIAGIPIGTNSIEYELSYQTAQQGLQGILTPEPITISGGQRVFNKELVLGTESSGRFVYHQVVGKIKVNVKFNGSYGSKIFEKEFEV